MTTIYDAQEQRLSRQAAIAKALRESGQISPQRAMQSSGRYIVPISPFEGFAKMAQTAMGILAENKTAKESEKLSEKKAKDMADFLRGVVDVQKPDELQPAEVTSQYRPENMAPEDAQRAIAAHGHYQDSVTSAQQSVDETGKARRMAQYMQGIQMGGPAADISASLIGREMPDKPTPFSLGEGEIRFDGSGKPIARGLPKTRGPVPKQLVDIVDPNSPGGYRTIDESEFQPGMQKWHKPDKADGVESSLGIDEDTLDLAAREVLQDPINMRTYASYGKSGQARRDLINGRVSKILKDTGMSAADLAQARARAKANIGSMNQLTKSLNAVESFEKLAKFNGERVLELIDEVNVTGVPAIEGYAQWAKNRGMADVDTAELKSVLMAYQTEVAKILTAPNLTGVLTDSAREEVKHMVNGDMSAPQLKRVIKRLDLEMKMRGDFIRQQIGSTSGFVPVVPGAPGVASAPGVAPVEGSEDPLGIRKK
jgi:hypothetical protein